MCRWVAMATHRPITAPGIPRQREQNASIVRRNSDLEQIRELVPKLKDQLGDARVAIVQEWISARAGSEKVFEAIAALVPNADLFALSIQPGVTIETGGREIATTVLDRPFFRNNLAAALPLMPMAWRRLDPDPYDVVITSSHAFSRCFVDERTPIHLSYVHSPARYVWFPEIDSRNGLAQRPFAAGPRRLLKGIDRRTIERTTALAANSSTTSKRIADVYSRDSTVIPPPVATAYYEAAPELDRTYLLAFSRFIPYKRLDEAIRVAHDLGEKLIVAGSGPEEARLRSLATELGADVEFKIRPTDPELRNLYAGAKALLFFAEEDFGIVPVEAQAAGCPVVTCGVGGATDTVVGGTTGIHAEDQSFPALREATARLLGQGFQASDSQANAQAFTYRSFAESVSGLLSAQLGSSH